MINDLWYKNAIIYCLSVGTYMDANGDGIGDFQGLMRRLFWATRPAEGTQSSYVFDRNRKRNAARIPPTGTSNVADGSGIEGATHPLPPAPAPVVFCTCAALRNVPCPPPGALR
jgi:hypothetical protein